ncbi:MAG: SRPBCC family protein [Longimicrobiales bacterium]
MRRDLHFEMYYPHAPEKVWRALTDRRAIERWLMPDDFEPRVGHRFRFVSKPTGGWDGIVNCEVLELEPNRRLVYTWKTNMLDTQVAFTLEPDGTGTRLRVDHTGFDGFRAWMVSLLMGGGWSKVMKQIGVVVGDDSWLVRATNHP